MDDASARMHQLSPAPSSAAATLNAHVLCSDTRIGALPRFLGAPALRVIDQRLDGRTEVLTLRLDLHYWPTFEIVQTEAGWVRTERQ